MCLCVTLLEAKSLKIDRLIAQPCDVWHRYQESWKEVNRRWILQVTSPTSAISAASASRQSKFCHRLSKNRHPAIWRAVDFVASQFQFCTTCIWWGWLLLWFPSGRDCGPTFTKFDGKVILSEAKWFLLVLIKKTATPIAMSCSFPALQTKSAVSYLSNGSIWKSSRTVEIEAHIFCLGHQATRWSRNKVETSDQVEL